MTSKRFQARHGLDNNNQTITRVANPANATDAANKQYVDAIGTTASNAIPLSQKGVPNGVATLDEAGLIPVSQLPSYVSDVIEYPSLGDFPSPGVSDKIYVAIDTHKVYRWSGSEYIEISPSAGTADAATRLATARTISLSGDVSGSASFDGSANITITTTVADDSHNHVISNINGLQSALDSKAAVGSVVPSANGTPSAGSATTAARSDHVHPLQTSVSGNAGTATKLATARAINGVSFDGTGDITVADSTKLPLTGGALTGSLTISSVEPHHVLEETDTTTRARTILSGGILYIQAGEMGQGANASSGNILFTGLNAQDVASLRVRTGGVSQDIWHAGNMADISQSEAETGTATSRRAWTAQRVRQAIAAYSLPLTGGTITGNTISINPASGNASLEVGSVRGVASTPYIDFHSGATTTDYDARILASGGDGTVGKGTLTYTASRHNFVGELNTNTASTSTASSHYFVATGSDGVLRPKTITNVRLEICTTIFNDTATNATYYPVFATATSGAMTDAKVSSTKLTFNPSTGDLSASNFNSLSDVNYKENVLKLEGSLDKVISMNGYSYDWKDGSGSSYGVIAQELIQIAPNAVGVDSEGKHTVNYAAVVPFLIEAIKEQQKQIEELKSKLG